MQNYHMAHWSSLAFFTLLAPCLYMNAKVGGSEEHRQPDDRFRRRAKKQLSAQGKEDSDEVDETAYR